MQTPFLPPAFLAVVAMTATTLAHDTWLEATPTVVRPGAAVDVALFLGNHGNEHRDFQVAGSLTSLAGVAVDVIAPDGRRTDLVPAMADVGSAPGTRSWTGRFVAAEEGLYCAAHLREGVRHGARGLKGGKTYFLAGTRPDDAGKPAGDHATPLGHPLELVVETHPVTGVGAGRPITVRLLHRGRPLPDHRVSFVPRGATLAAGFDAEHERLTDADGRCGYTPRDRGLLLVVAHLVAPEERGDGYDRTSYASTLVLAVP